jgi:hypothetical protein
MNNRTDEQYRKAYKKILRTSHERGGQYTPDFVIDGVDRLSISTVKQRVKAFENKMKKQEKVSKEGDLNSMSVNQLKRLYRKYARQLKISEKQINDDVKYFYYTKPSLIANIARLVNKIEKKNKKTKKPKLHNKSKKTKKSSKSRK